MIKKGAVASQANGTRWYIIWYTKTSSDIRTGEEVMERQERGTSRDFAVLGVIFCPVMVYWILFVCLCGLFCCCCLLACLTLSCFLSWMGDATEMRGDYEGTGR